MTATDTHSMTYWRATRELAEASVAPEATRLCGTVVSSSITPTDTGNYCVEVTYTTPAAFAGKRAYIEHVYDLPCDDGSENFNLWTTDNHVAGPFASAAEARRWAKREGILSVEAKVRRVSAPW